MRDEALNKIDEIIDIIKNSDEYKNYVAVSEKMKQNEEVMSLVNDIKKLQKQIVKDTSLGKDIKGLDKEIQEKIKKLEEFPIYLEYTYLEEDLNTVFQTIKLTLENYINDKTN